MAVAVVLSTSCAGSLQSVSRGDWVLVTGDDKAQEIITRDDYAAEVTEGRDRMVKVAVDEKPPVLHEAPEKLTAVAGEVLRFRVNEGGEVDLLSDGAVAEVFWTESKRVDGWNGDQAVEGKESQVFIRTKKAGKGKLRLIDPTWGTHDYELTVTSPK